MFVCFATGGLNPFEGAKSSQLIELQQTGFDRFTVVYGLQVKSGLDYASAAAELGECIMHMQACEGMLDNRTKSEARAAGDTAPHFEGATNKPVGGLAPLV